MKAFFNLAFLVCTLTIYAQNDENPQIKDIYVLYQNTKTMKWDFLEPKNEDYPIFEDERTDFDNISNVGELPLIVKNKKGIKFHNAVYDISKPGLYKLINSDKEFFNLISINKKTKPLELVAALTALTMHGNKDNRAGYDLLKTQPAISITCHYNRMLMMDFLVNELGFPENNVRGVNVLTTAEHNNYDNGHSVFEIKIDNSWVLVDGDLNLMFKYKGDFLSAEDLAKLVEKNKKPEFVPIAIKDFKIDPVFLDERSGFNYAGLTLAKFSNDVMLWNWIKKVYQKITYFKPY